MPWPSYALTYLSLLATLCFLVVMTTMTNDSLSLPLDLDIDEEDSVPQTDQQVQVFAKSTARYVKIKDRAMKIKDCDYFLRPPYFPLVLKPKSNDYIFPASFYSKKIYVTKEGHLLSDSKDMIITHFRRQLEICRNIYTKRKQYFLSNVLNKHHEFTQLANVLWDRYKAIELSVNKLFLELPLSLKFKLKQYHIEEKKIKLSDWWNIENTLDMEFTKLFNKIRYDLYQAFDIFDAELHLTCFHFDKHLDDLSVDKEPTFATIRRLQFNDSLIESDEEMLK